MTINYLIMQIFYWAVFCNLFSFSNSFLSYKGFSTLDIGYTLSIASIIAVTIQPYITKIVYKYKNINLKKVIILSLLSMTISYFFIIYYNDFKILMIAYVIVLIGLFNIQTYMYPFIFEYINSGYKINFGLARGFGSLSYSLTSYLIGMISIKLNSFNFIPYLTLFLTIIIIFSMFTFKSLEHIQKSNKKDISLFDFFKKYKKFSYALLGLTLVFTTHNALNTFLKNIIESINYTNYEVGISYMLASIVELPVMLLVPILSRKKSYASLFMISTIGFSLKCFFTLIGVFTGSLYIIYFAQLLQTLGFALHLPVSLYYVNNILDSNDVVKGQTFLGVSLTLGGITGNMLAGKILEKNSTIILLIILTIITFIGTIIVIFNTEYKKKF